MVDASDVARLTGASTARAYATVSRLVEAGVLVDRLRLRRLESRAAATAPGNPWPAPTAP